MNRRLVFAMIAALAAGRVSAQETRIGLMIDIDPATSERLIAMGEWIIVSSYYFGDPATKDAPVDEMGQVYLGAEQATIYPVSQYVVIGGAIAGAPLDWVVAPRVNVNIYTARISDENNLINCDFVDDEVAVVAAADNVLKCTWLGD